MAKVDVKEVRDAADALRDLKNWLAVFKTEYDVSEEAVKVLHQKVDEIGNKMNGIKCVGKNVDSGSVKTVASSLRDAKSWLAVFAKEYDIDKEAVKILHQQFDKFGDKLAVVKCK